MIVTNATDSLLRQFYGKLPAQSIRALVAVENNKPIAVAGLRTVENGTILFSDMSDEFRNHKLFKRTLIKGYRELVKMFHGRVYAKAQDGVEGADVLLNHLGFVQDGDVWHN